MIDQDTLTREALRWADMTGAPEEPVATPVEGLSVTRMRRPTPLEPLVYRPIFCLVLQGTKAAHFGDRVVSFSAGEALVVSHDLPAISQVTEASAKAPYVALALALDIPLMRELAAEVEPLLIREAPEQSANAGAVTDELLDAVGRLWGMIDDPWARPVLEPMLRREIHLRLMQCPHATMLRRLMQADSHASRIGRAIILLRQRYAEPLKVAELAAEAGMSGSSFHEHFRAITGTTPLQYQKQLRLIEARRLLQTGGRSVGSVAFDVGYESPTQFSREYARQFGTAPRNDLAVAGASVLQHHAGL